MQRQSIEKINHQQLTSRRRLPRLRLCCSQIGGEAWQVPSGDFWQVPSGDKKQVASGDFQIRMVSIWFFFNQANSPQISLLICVLLCSTKVQHSLQFSWRSQMHGREQGISTPMVIIMIILASMIMIILE